MKRVALQAQAAGMIAMAAPLAALAAPALVAFRRSMAATVLAARGRTSAEPVDPDSTAPVEAAPAPAVPPTRTYTARGQAGRAAAVTLPAGPGDTDPS